MELHLTSKSLLFTLTLPSQSDPKVMDSLVDFILKRVPLEQIQAETPKLITFAFLLLLASIIGRYTPSLASWVIKRLFPKSMLGAYDYLIKPLERQFQIVGTLILLSNLSLLAPNEEPYRQVYTLVATTAGLAAIFSCAWLASQFFQRLIRSYGLELFKRLGREGDDMFLILETMANVIIGFIAILAFAQSLGSNLIAILTGFGVGGLAVAFAAQKILEQLLSTIVLYLDRPFTQGDYIRLPDGQIGRVESIGLRSSKIRTTAKSTVLIVPNSNLVSSQIENLSMAKKVMVMLYLDFSRKLQDQDQALVQQVIREETNTLFGIDPGSTTIVFNDSEKQNQRARVTFFILGSKENSFELRKRLLELANERITKRLDSYSIQFITQDPTIYVDAPITL